MDTGSNPNSAENLASAPRVETVSTPRPESSKVDRTKEQMADAVDVVEGVEGSETMEDVDGKISEVMSETTREDKKGMGSGGATSGAYDPTQIRTELLKNLPSERVMKSQIEKEVRKEIRYLHRKAIKMLRSPGSMSYFEMSNLMKKIRELKGLLAVLAKASLEALKTLWLRFVHGVM